MFPAPELRCLGWHIAQSTWACNAGTLPPGGRVRHNLLPHLEKVNTNLEAPGIVVSKKQIINHRSG